MQPNWFGRVAYLLLRLFAGLIMLQSGGTKIFGWLGGMPPGTPVDGWVTTGGWIEVVGGTLMLIGLFTRPAAFILSGTMAVAYWKFHYKWGEPGTVWTWPTQNHGTAAAVLCFVFLLFAAHGAGMLSVDEGRSLRKASTPKPKS
jgi:putative oxidoreductase